MTDAHVHTMPRRPRRYACVGESECVSLSLPDGQGIIILIATLALTHKETAGSTGLKNVLGVPTRHVEVVPARGGEKNLV